MEQVVKTLCPYCGVGCGLVAKVRDGRIAEVRGDKDHPSSLGALCNKGATLGEIVATPNRLTRAHVHGEPTSLDEALQFLAGRFKALGRDAVGFYISGQLTTEAIYVFNKLAKGALGTNHIDSNSRLCMASAAAAYKLAFGSDGPPTCYDDIEHAECFLVVGANMAECHPVLWQRIKKRAARQRVRIVAVDPRRTPTAADAHLHLPIKPGTDVALLNAMLHVMIAQGWISQRFIRDHTENFEAVRDLVEGWSPARAAKVCGIEETLIHRAAFWFGASAEALSLYAMGANQSTQGVAKNLAVINLHLATGKLGRPGSGPFSLTGQPNAMGGREVGYMSGGLPGYRDVSNPDHRKEIAGIWGVPAARIQPKPGLDAVAMFEALETGKLKAIWIVGTNPLATMPNSNQIRRALQRAELVVVQDCYHPTETSRLAHVLLPAAMSVEVEGTMTNSERRITLLRPCVAPPGDARPDWEIACRFAAMMGFEEQFSFTSASDVFEELKQCSSEYLAVLGISYSRLKRHVVQWPCPTPASHGLARRYRNKRFHTPSGKAQFHAVEFHPPVDAQNAPYPLALTTGRIASQWHTRTKTGHVAKLTKLCSAPFVAVSPADAQALDLMDGEKVRVVSRRGFARSTVRVDKTVPAGAVFMTMHWGEGDACVNACTTGDADEQSRQPELKYSAVRLEKDA
jgi:anaerobic selenocysteine-containing dehydrogenase